jgi:hypothetical protein
VEPGTFATVLSSVAVASPGRVGNPSKTPAASVVSIEVSEPDSHIVVFAVTFSDGQAARYETRFDVEARGRLVNYRRYPGGPRPAVVRAAARAWRTRGNTRTHDEASAKARTFLALYGISGPDRPNGRPVLAVEVAERFVAEYERARMCRRTVADRNQLLAEWGWPRGPEGVKSRLRTARSVVATQRRADETRRLDQAVIRGFCR